MQISIFLFAFVIASCAAQTWNRLNGALNDISAKGNEVWGISSGDKIWRYNGNTWIQMPGLAVSVGASADGRTWVVNRTGQIFRFNLTTKKWDLIPGQLKQISAMSGDKALGVNAAGGIFLYENNKWIQLPGAATWAGIGDGDERWVVNSSQQIYRWNPFTNVWDRVPGAAVNVDVQNPCRVIVTNAANQIYIWKDNVWERLTGAGKRSTLNGIRYYTVNSYDEIYQSAPNGGCACM